MECLYCPDFNQNNSIIKLPEDELKHLKVLRLKEGEDIFVSNGKGLITHSRVEFNNREPLIVPIEFLPNYGELKHSITIAICQIQYREKLEFLIEKAVELGVTEIIIIHCDYSQKFNIQQERLKNKAIAALKQSHRSVLPSIKLEKSLSSFILNYNKALIPILLDEKGKNPLEEMIKQDSILFVGCEGGFSAKELEAIGKIEHLHRWNLGTRRLRAETAAIKGISILSAMIEK
ncbi:MAG TPA: RsmE family RNA methyltransferase [Candidatus Kapabacteria bacterium]|nr:RsmE family RNA methyltransferase [Candidatus Kapabacteria bacterium]